MNKAELVELKELWQKRPRYTYGDTRKWQSETLQFLAETTLFLKTFGSKFESFIHHLEASS